MTIDARRGVDLRRMAQALPDLPGLDGYQSAEAWAELIAMTNPDIVDDSTQIVRCDGELNIPSLEEAEERVTETYWGMSQENGSSAQCTELDPNVIPADQLYRMRNTPELRLDEVAAEGRLRAARHWDPMNSENDFLRPRGLLETGYVPPTAINPAMVTMGDQLFEDVRSMIPLDDVPPEVMTQIRDYCDMPQRTAHLSSTQSRTFHFRDDSDRERRITVTLSPRVTYFRHLGADQHERQVERSTEATTTFQSDVSHERSRRESSDVSVMVPVGGGAQLRVGGGGFEERATESGVGHSEQIRSSRGNVTRLDGVERFQADVSYRIEVGTHVEQRSGAVEENTVEGSSALIDVRFSMAAEDCVGGQRGRAERGAER